MKFIFTAENSTQKFAFSGGEALLSWSATGETASLRIALPYEAVWGMGEKFDALNQKGRTVVNRVEEKFCRQGEKTYCPAPFFFTDTGFGLYVETDCETTFTFGDEIAVELPVDAPVRLLAGTPGEIVAQYMELFGPAVLPPKWALGPWISANHWDTQEKALNQLELLKKYDCPATVLVLEAWSDEATFYCFNGAAYEPVPGDKALSYEDFDFSHSQWPDPREMAKAMHQAGVRLVLWQAPVYKQQGPDEILNAQNENDREYVKKKKLCVQTAEGPYTIPQGFWFPGSMIPDFTNGEAKNLWFKKRQYLLELGVDGFKTDGGEFIHRMEVHTADGSTGRALKNRYARDYTGAYAEFLGKDRVQFSRAGYAGQHRTPMLWAGDQQSENAELKGQLCAGLSAAMTGIPFWGFDIGGFAGPLPTLDLYRRATQLACFCPVMQWHSEPDGGQFRELAPTAEGNNERSPWNLEKAYGQPGFAEEMAIWHRLRMNLLPYLYNTALDCVRESRPMMRPLAYEFPEDPTAKTVEDEFLLGESLLVAPLLEENAKERKVYFPQGQWIPFFQDHQFPVYLRGGHGVALNLNAFGELGGSVGNSTDRYENLTFWLAGARGSFHFADDLGSELTLCWDETGWSQQGRCAAPFTVRVIL